MKRIEISAPSKVTLVVGDHEQDVDLFAVRLWSDEAGKRIGEFNTEYFNEMRAYL
jgi:hypothetical protein